jgi:putative Holliday junction resolvase
LRILAIDYGKKRCGLAVTDPLKLIATHLEAMPTSELLSYLKTYCQKEIVEGFVLGKPLTLNNELNDIAKEIDQFKGQLKSIIPR